MPLELVPAALRNIVAAHTGQSSQLFPVATGRNAQFLATLGISHNVIHTDAGSHKNEKLSNARHHPPAAALTDKRLADCGRCMRSLGVFTPQTPHYLVPYLASNVLRTWLAS